MRFWASDESEVGAEFQNEGFQFPKDGVLNVLFDVVTEQFVRSNRGPGGRMTACGRQGIVFFE
jgi:hypothetical protein